MEAGCPNEAPRQSCAVMKFTKKRKAALSIMTKSWLRRYSTMSSSIAASWTGGKRRILHGDRSITVTCSKADGWSDRRWSLWEHLCCYFGDGERRASAYTGSSSAVDLASLGGKKMRAETQTCRDEDFVHGRRERAEAHVDRDGNLVL